MLPAGGGVSQQRKDHPHRAFQGRKAESRAAGAEGGVVVKPEGQEGTARSNWLGLELFQ